MPDVKEKMVAVNGSGGAYVSITADWACRGLEVVEAPDPATYDGTNFNAQGLTYQLPTDAFATTLAVEPGEPINRGNRIAEGNGFGPLLGGPAQNTPGGQVIAATVLLKVRSATATGTQVKVRYIP